jgi:sulfate transport system substrate-binding protein
MVDPMEDRMLKRARAAVALAGIAAAGLALAGCGSASGGSGGKVTLSLVAYSTPQAAYQEIIKAFQVTPAGRDVTFKQSYGASGDQSRAVAAGLRADVVAFSLEPDMTRLVKAGLVADGWNADPAHGFITDSVVVIATRKGNPKHLTTWSDLTRPGVEVITPNPFTSGGARWNVLAGYGATSDRNADQAAGVEYLSALFNNVPVQDDSARKSLQTFVSGKGDAMLAYENEAIFAQKNHQPLDYTVPDATVLIENPVAVTTDSRHPEQAEAFLAFLHTRTAQEIFAESGYRPVVDVPGADYPEPAQLFTIGDLGGWTQVNKVFFDPSTGIMAEIERRLGVSVVK